jgi:hypothetical protein
MRPHTITSDTAYGICPCVTLTVTLIARSVSSTVQMHGWVLANTRPYYSKVDDGGQR